MEGYNTGQAMNQRSAGGLAGGANTPKPISQMHMHASQLQEQANRLHEQVARLSEIIDRFAGPSPPNGPDALKEVQPIGVLVVAQFESRRISEGIGNLIDQINRLDSIA